MRETRNGGQAWALIVILTCNAEGKASYTTFESGELKAVELSANKDGPWGKEEETLINGHVESSRQS